MCPLKNLSLLVGMFPQYVSAHLWSRLPVSSQWHCCEGVYLSHEYFWADDLASCNTKKLPISSVFKDYVTQHQLSVVSTLWLISQSLQRHYTQFQSFILWKPVSSNHSTGPMAPRIHHHFLSGALEDVARLAKINAVSTVTIAVLCCRPLYSHSVGWLCTATDVVRGVGLKCKTSWL